MAFAVTQCVFCAVILALLFSGAWNRRAEEYDGDAGGSGRRRLMSQEAKRLNELFSLSDHWGKNLRGALRPFIAR